MKDSVSFPSQDSKIIHNSDVIIFFMSLSLSWFCSVLQAALNIFVHVLLYMCRCLSLQCRTRHNMSSF